MFLQNRAVFEAARDAWRLHAPTRARRRRLMQHTYGDQWSDPVETSEYGCITEHDKAVMAGMRPLTNNLLRSLVKSIVGRFRYNITREGEEPSEVLRRLRADNFLSELDSRALEEYLISGCVIQKVVCERRSGGGLGVWVDNISPESFFCNRFLDPRGNDIRIVGMVHDMGVDELKLRFGHGSRRRCQRLERAYRELRSRRMDESLFSADSDILADFTRPRSPELCRVIEVWTFDIDSSSPHVDPHWHCRYLLPDSRVIDESRSHLPSGSHPFAVKFYPLTDGEIHPFIEDLVGQQKHINLLVTTIDHILANSAKGALLMPVDALPKGVDMEQVSNLWSKPGSVIPINSGCRQLPTEITSQGRSEGAARLLDMEMKLFQQISGVTSALQGQPSGSSTSASLYESQVYNSTIALLDLYESFNSFRELRDRIALEYINIFLH